MRKLVSVAGRELFPKADKALYASNHFLARGIIIGVNMGQM